MKIIAALLVVFMLTIFVQMLYVDNAYPDYKAMIKQKNTDFERAYEGIMALYAASDSLQTGGQQEIARLHAVENAIQVSIDSLSVLEHERVKSKWSSKLLDTLGL